MQNTKDFEMGLIDIAMLITMDTFNNVNLVKNGLQVSLANGKTATISIKKVEDSHLIENSLKEKIDLKKLKKMFDNQNEKIILHNACHLMQYLNYCLPDIFFASMLSRNVFLLENKFYQICIN